MLKIGIIIQARMMSTRLPGKVLSRVAGNHLMLECVINRLKLCNVNQIIVATSDEFPDDSIAKLCLDQNIPCFRGSENDVLERYYLAAKKYKLDIILRVTADCPLIDPQIVNQLIEFFLNNKVDYASNVLQRKYPRGMDIEIFTFNALEKAHYSATAEDEREHVTSYLYKNPNKFKLINLDAIKDDLSHYRLTVDTKEDLDLVRKIYRELSGGSFDIDFDFTLDEIIQVMEEHPEWHQINSHINQKYYSSQEYLNALKDVD